MNVPQSLEPSRSAIRVCGECYSLMHPEDPVCPACGDNVRNRAVVGRVTTILAVGLVVGVLVFQLFH